MGRMLGIYIHIPFCRSKCDYCDFYSLAGKEQWMDSYLKALLFQIKEKAGELRDYQVDTIYFGGGTPSYYGEGRLREILSVIRKHYAVSRTPEITVECNPDSVDKKSLLRLRRAGVNRISLGMQSGDPVQLCALNRPHDMNQVEAAVELLREVKIENISLDLIYGLPGQSMESWQESLRQAMALAPEHISAYGLKVEEGTPLFKRVLSGEEIADDDLQADMYLWMMDTLAKNGYRQYELSNFSKTAKESRHNLKYWMGREYLGFGPGAHSDLAGVRFSYQRDLEGFIAGVLHGENVLDEYEEISKAERAREYLMLRMRTQRGIEEWEYRREFTMNFDAIEQKLLQFEGQGLTAQSGDRWHFTPKGFLLSNTLISQLMDCQEIPLEEPEDRAEPS